MSRKLILEVFRGRPLALAIYQTLLAMANWEEGRMPTVNGPIKVPPGTTITTFKELAEQLDLDRRTVSRWIKFLEINDLIKLTKGPEVYVTICIDPVIWDDVSTHVSTHAVVHASTHVSVDATQMQLKCSHKKKEETTIKNQEVSPKGEPRPKGLGTPVWESYSLAYEKRYGTKPARNARDAALCKQFVERVGQEDAPKIAEFYLTHHNQYYIAKLHPLNIMLGDAQKLRTEWLMGAKMTTEIAKGCEISAHNDEVVKRFWEKEKLKDAER